MKQYTASVCINSQNNTVVITCPKADLLTFWQLDSNEFIVTIISHYMNISRLIVDIHVHVCQTDKNKN